MRVPLVTFAIPEAAIDNGPHLARSRHGGSATLNAASW